VFKTAKRAQVGILLSLVALWPQALAQTGGNPSGWDPITGWADGNAAVREYDSSSSGRSAWSFSRSIDMNSTGRYEPPGTFGGIVINSEGRRCGGPFRMVNC
jgi:hypothetical protein